MRSVAPAADAVLPSSIGVGGHQFLILDGIRGVAALFVVMRHTSRLWGFMPYRSYLAVDLFFVLSGFVIAHAYDRKLVSRQLSRADFARLRLIRLYPMYALSVLLCAVVFIGSSDIGSGGFPPHFAAEMLTRFFALFFLPVHLTVNSELFPFNYVYWSLFFELLVNFLYSWLRLTLSPRMHVGVLLAAFLVLVGVARIHGSLDLGSEWGFEHLVGGTARAVFGIYLGVCLCLWRAELLSWLKLRSGYLLVMLIIAAALASPSAGAYNGLVDLILVSIVFPLCILWAAHGAVGRSAAILAVLGAASYPIYLFHLPAAKILEKALHHAPSPYAPLSGLVFAAVLIGLAVVGERVYDIPVRRWLKQRSIHYPARLRI